MRQTLLSTQPDIPYGYRRLIFVLRDRFNNTLYVPIDADIANQTVIQLNVTPAVNPLNPNSTTININGYAGYYAYNSQGNQFYPLPTLRYTCTTTTTSTSTALPPAR